MDQDPGPGPRTRTRPRLRTTCQIPNPIFALPAAACSSICSVKDLVSQPVFPSGRVPHQTRRVLCCMRQACPRADLISSDPHPASYCYHFVLYTLARPVARASPCAALPPCRYFSPLPLASDLEPHPCPWPRQLQLKLETCELSRSRLEESRATTRARAGARAGAELSCAALCCALCRALCAAVPDTPGLWPLASDLCLRSDWEIESLSPSRPGRSSARAAGNQDPSCPCPNLSRPAISHRVPS